MENLEIESAIEGILFASGEPVKIDRIAAVLELDRKEILNAAASLMGKYSLERRGIRVIMMDKVLQMVSAPEQADIIRKTLEERKPQPISKAALEVLSLVAYYQPITRAEIDKIRGADSSYTVSSMAEKGLIEEAGRLEVPGRPILYRTTPSFLRAFGMSSLEELPEVTELEGQLTFDIVARELSERAREGERSVEEET